MLRYELEFILIGIIIYLYLEFFINEFSYLCLNVLF